MNDRPKRIKKNIAEAPAQRPRKWDKEEMRNLLQCLMKNGHKNFEKLEECIPGRSIENIKTFMRTVYDNGTRRNESDSYVDRWIDLCLDVNVREVPWKDCLQIAQVIKYLSVDGLLENHPLLNNSQNINFAEAYRFIYQALMGYPLQPVSPETGKFIHETLAELNNEAKNEIQVIKKINDFLKQTISSEEKKNNDNELPVKNISSQSESKIKKSVKVYQRKKPKLSSNNETSEIPIKIMVAPNSNETSNSPFMQDFLVLIEGNESKFPSTVVNVPVPKSGIQSKPSKEEEEIFKSKSYNPFKIPENCVKEPVYLNIMQQL